MKNMKVFSILILWNTWKWFQINVVKYMKVISTLVFFFFFVKYMKVIATFVFWNTWKWFQVSIVKYMKVISTMILWNTWKWFQHLFSETHESDFRLALWNTWKWFQQWFCLFKSDCWNEIREMSIVESIFGNQALVVKDPTHAIQYSPLIVLYFERKEIDSL